jgi:hypothetical protein
VDQASAGKSRNAANNAGNAPHETGTSRTWYAGDKTVDGEAEYTSCATAEARAAEHSTGAAAEPAATEAYADAAFYATSETDTGNEAGAAFESVHSARAEQSVNAANATIDASGVETEHADDSARAGARTRPRCKRAKAGAQFTNRTAKQFASIATEQIEFAAESIV